MPTVTQEEVAANLPRLIDDAARCGDEIWVTRDHIMVAKIIPVSASAKGADVSPTPISHEAWLALLHHAPHIAVEYPSPSVESLRREFIYEDRA